MAFDKRQFEDLIRRVLERLKMHSDAAVNLLLGTAAQESAFGTYLRQRGGGPALGVFQMEPDTARDIWTNYIYFRMELADLIWHTTGEAGHSDRALESNIAYQVVMARLHYRRESEPLPAADDIEGMARYWKRHYNTMQGKGTEVEFVKNYQKYLGA